MNHYSYIVNKNTIKWEYLWQKGEIWTVQNDFAAEEDLEICGFTSEPIVTAECISLFSFNDDYLNENDTNLTSNNETTRNINTSSKTTNNMMNFDVSSNDKKNYHLGFYYSFS